MLTNNTVHERLRHCRGVLLVMAKFSEADDVNNNVLLELHAVVNSQLSDKDHRLGVIAIYVEDRRFNHLDHIGAVQGGSRIARVGRGETNLVVNNNVDGSPNAIAARHGKVQGLHDHALACEGGITMYKHRQNFATFVITPSIEASSN